MVDKDDPSVNFVWTQLRKNEFVENLKTIKRERLPLYGGFQSDSLSDTTEEESVFKKLTMKDNWWFKLLSMNDFMQI